MSLIFCGRSTTDKFCGSFVGDAAGGVTVVVTVVFAFELSAVVQADSPTNAQQATHTNRMRDTSFIACLRMDSRFAASITKEGKRHKSSRQKAVGGRQLKTKRRLLVECAAHCAEPRSNQQPFVYSELPTAYCLLPTIFSEPHVLDRRVLLTLGALICCAVEFGVELDERFDLDAVNLCGCVTEADDCAAADDLRAQLADN